MIQRRLVVLLVVLAAVVPYLPTLDDYFVQDDFGVVGLLSAKPAGYFPQWFVSNWMDDIWGYTPDEIRPFPAVTYQLAAWWGAASPVANHVINVGFHATNTMLVFGIAETAAGLALGPAAFAALVFAVLPMQTESVAWVTGRVDSMPACFYLASFLLYARWRARPRAAVYIWSVVVYFVALFTKQNAVTLPAAIVLYDALVARHPPRPTWSWLRPYIPFAVLTMGYLGLRYALFGEVAREGMLTAARFDTFLQDLSVHLRRMVIGEAGLECVRAHDRDTRCGGRRRDRRDRRARRRAGARDHQAGRLLSCCLDWSGGCADAGRRLRIPASHVPGIRRVGSGARRCVGCALARTAGSADAGAGRHRLGSAPGDVRLATLAGRSALGRSVGGVAARGRRCRTRSPGGPTGNAHHRGRAAAELELRTAACPAPTFHRRRPRAAREGDFPLVDSLLPGASVGAIHQRCDAHLAREIRLSRR